MRWIPLILLLVPLSARALGEELYAERYRPQFHFSAAKGWLGDPNGLIRHRGIYHLFWWGHAVSKDLVHWKELPNPMTGDDGSFKYFSGSVVVDERNSGGFGNGVNPPMVAIYTAHRQAGDDQRLSYSKDYRTFHYYKGSPVLAALPTSERDPDIFWHAPSGRWIMATTVPEKHQINLYSSTDLKSWTHQSSFGPLGARAENWEVPNLFELPMEGGGRKWVMLCGMGPNKAQYFTGNFDGVQFTPDDKTLSYLAKTDAAAPGREHARWIDWGSDFYAVRAFRDLDQSGKVASWIGWMGNWEYANEVPKTWGRGALSIPRVIRLVNTADGPQIYQRPLPALKELRGVPFVVAPTDRAGVLWSPARNTYELETEFAFDKDAGAVGLDLCAGAKQKVRLGFDPRTSEVFLDRRQSGEVGFSQKFPVVAKALLRPDQRTVKFHVFVDQSSIEVFVNDGEAVMTSLIFPDPESREVRMFSETAGSRLTGMTAWSLKSIWAGDRANAMEVEP